MSRESSLKVSFMDGLFASIMLGFTLNYIAPFALLLGASNFSIGLLSSIPVLIGSFVQIKSTEVFEWMNNRVKGIMVFCVLQGIAIAISGFVFLVPLQFRVETFLFLVVINTIFGSISAPVWLSLMSHTVEKHKYGVYFAWRGKVLGFINLCGSFVAGFFLFIIPSKLVGFIVLFLVAGICRVISGIYIGKMDDLTVRTSEKKDFTYFQFIKRISESNFAKFVLFVSLINFSAFLAAPFFIVYMLKELKFTYATYTIIVSASALAGLLLVPFWGKLADKYGNVKVIKSSAILTPILPLLWIFSKNPVYLTIINTFGGYVWVGFNLAIVNFIFDAASPEVRARCAAYYNFTVGVFVFLGATLGGWLATHLKFEIFGSTLLTLFLISGAARLLVNVFMLKSFREVREAEKIEDRKMLHIVLGITPVLSLSEEIYKKKV
ncbi:MAG: MFS transporter [Elusimicrobia bacterium]|nr:MFS transporter [Elusimicrobiota bacterium]